MESNDLRIGNFAKIGMRNCVILEIMQGNCKVSMPISENRYSESIAPYEDIEPIPLTPEILSKIGGIEKLGYVTFNYDKAAGLLYKLNAINIFVPDNGVPEINLEVFDRDNKTYGHKIELPYLHTLQNAIYVLLTGKELTITLK